MKAVQIPLLSRICAPFHCARLFNTRISHQTVNDAVGGAVNDLGSERNPATRLFYENEKALEIISLFI